MHAVSIVRFNINVVSTNVVSTNVVSANFVSTHVSKMENSLT
jgi:hypothetical protein